MRAEVCMRAYVIAALIAGQVVPKAMAQDPPCRWITVRDGLPSNHVYWSMQDHEGWMWFGTDAGAARYDGHRFEVFNSSNGAADNEILKLIEDSRGRVWFLTLNGELSFWWKGRMHNASTDPGLAHLRLKQGICSFQEHTDGSLWFGGHGQEVLRLSADLTRSECYDLGELMNTRSNVLLYPGDGASPRILSGKLVLRLVHGRFVVQDRITDPPGDVFLTSRLPALGWVVTTKNGLARLEHLDEPLPVTTGVPRSTPRWISADNSGGLWWSLLHGGLVRTFWNGHALEGERTSFANELIASLYEDKDGNHWIATSTHGVGFITSQQRQLHWYPASSGSGPEGIMSTLVTPKGKLLCGTDRGHLLIMDDGGLVPLAGSEPLRDKGRILCMAVDGDRIWTAQDGAVHMFLLDRDPIRLTPVLFKLEGDPADDQGWLGGSKSIAVGPDGSVAGCFNTIYRFEHQGKSWSTTMSATALASSSRIYAPFFDTQGDLWYDRENRLHRVHEGREMEYPELDTLLRVRITDIVGIDANTIAVSSAGSGVTILRNGAVIARLTRASGLVSDQCRQLAVRNGRLLVATDRGASIVPLPVGSAPFQSWSLANGLPTNDILSVEGDSANIYLGTGDGLVVLPCSIDERTGPPPTLTYAALSYGDTIFQPGSYVEIPYGTGRVSLRAFTPWFGDPTLLEYAFKTANDAPWQSCANGAVTLASWGSGDMVMRMRARRSGSDWCAPITLTLHVEPPWYLRTWVHVIAVLLGLSIALLFVSAFIRHRYRRALAHLEKERALTDERIRIAEDMHDDLGADLSHLLMMTRLAREDKPGSKALLEHIEQLSDHMVQKIDDIVWSLDPRSDTVAATLDHLHQRAGTQCERTGIAFHGSLGTDPRERQLGAGQRRDLQMAMKELLTNAIKHGKRSGVHLWSFVQEHGLRIELQHDVRTGPRDGPRHPRIGRGMENMQRRLARHGGQLEGPRRSDRGFTWTITLPLERAERTR
ncbi:MAG TPA: two-component regulator propeller domain-containing protein, partial [Flavobacteriales bacterium]|nr:two-component regulator propeller domain-containing protein [Flavobacteriales bacterium]